MNDKNIQIHFKRILEYAIFSRSPLNISPHLRQEDRVSFRVISYNDADFLAEIRDDISAIDLISRWKQNHLEARMGFKSAGLLFATTLSDYQDNDIANGKSEKAKIAFKLPSTTQLLNKRPSPRLSLSHIALTFVGQIQTDKGRTEIISHRIRDISETAISFWVDSVASCLETGTAIEILDVIKDGKTIIHACGLVLKIITPIHEPFRQTKLVIVQLKSLELPHSRKQRRTAERLVLLDQFNRAYIDFSFPLIQGEHIYAHVIDLSEEGILFEIPHAEIPLAPGMLFEGATILLPHHSPRCLAVQITHRSTMQKNGVRYCRAGGAFASIEPAIKEWLKNAISFIATLKNMKLKMPTEISLLGEEEQLSGTLIANTVHGQRELSIHRYIDFCHTWIGFHIARTEGLLLLGDEIIQMQLKRAKDTIIACNGKVIHSECADKLQNNDNLYYIRVAVGQNSILQTHERSHTRAPMGSDETRAYVEFSHPLIKGQTLYGYVIDISAEGIAFIVSRNPLPLLTGMIITEMAIQLPYQKRFLISLEVVSCSLVQGPVSGYRIGGKFVKAEGQHIIQISRSVQEYIDGHLTDLTPSDYEALWELFFESGFIYGSKRQQIGRYTEKIFATHLILLRTNTAFYKKIVYRSGGEICGHISGLHFFDHGWLAQHLMATNVNNGEVARIVLYGFINGFLSAHKSAPPRTNYLCFFYREENVFPAVVFGGIRTKTHDKEICSSKEFDFCVPNSYNNNSTEPSESNGRYIMHEATENELAHAEEAILATGEFHFFRLEGLSRETLLNLDVSKEYTAVGLYRFRKVLTLIDMETGIMCFAVCNFASPGLNFSELTNSWRFYFYGDPNVSLAKEISNMLAGYVLSIYKKTEMPEPVLLLSPGQQCPSQFSIKKRYTYLYFDLHYISMLYHAISEVFDNLKDSLRAYKQNKVTV